MLSCGSRTSIPRSSSWSLPSVGCMVTMAPLLLEVPWDVEGTITAYHVTRTPVSNVWSCTDVQRTRPSAAYSVNSVGRWDEVGVVAGLWEPRESTFHRNMAVCEGRRQRSFPCWRRRSSLRSIVHARRQSRDALCLPCSARRPCTLNTEAFIGPR
jgi:hypothetical protein